MSRYGQYKYSNKISGAAIITSFVALTACGVQPGSKDMGLQSLSSSLNCEGNLASNINEVELQAQGLAKADQIVSYSLSKNAGCTGANQVEWNSPSAKLSGVSEQGLNSAYSEPGIYKASASLITQNGNLGSVVSSATVVVGSRPVLVGPQMAFEFVEMNYQVLLPEDYNLSSIEWNFGDGPVQSGQNTSVTKSYFRSGSYILNVRVTDADGQSHDLSQVVQVHPFFEDLLCAANLSISGPVETPAGQSAQYATLLPGCVQDFNPSVSWDMGDSSALKAGETVNHTYVASGEVVVKATIQLHHPRVRQIVLTLPVLVTPSDVDLHQCPQLGETRQRTGSQRTEEESCGVLGTRQLVYQETVTEECRLLGNYRGWEVVSQSEELISTGACGGQACEIPAGSLSNVDLSQFNLIHNQGRYYMRDGQSLSFYSENLPTNTCDSVRQTRSCSNGTLSGQSNYVHLSCISGCGDFGPHGTVKNDIVTGEIQVEKQCSFNEAGIFDIFDELSDKQCHMGQIQTLNTRRGDIRTAGLCPTYSWSATDIFTVCDANCGGKQSREFVCRNNLGETASVERCTEPKPVEERLCDANPDAVRRTDVEESVQEDRTSKLCPANQIGVIVRERSVKVTTAYACINHQVAAVDSQTEYGDWSEQNYCRDYVAYRCNHDSLSQSEAKGRLAWMEKCRSQVPVIDEFLTQFADVEGKRGKETSSLGSSRSLYPTFMRRSGNKDVVWKAPTSVSGSCNVPSGIFVSAVCVASCATPEQEIIAQSADGKMDKIAFVDALVGGYAFVGTLGKNSTINSKSLKKTKVEQWVTELIESEHEILNFRTASGSVLRLTTNHPVVTTAGTLKTADAFKVGESLVKLGGVADRIVSITPEIYFGKVYNVFVQSNDLKENIVVTNGFLNGTAYYQNEGSKDLNRQVLRGRVTRGVFSE